MLTYLSEYQCISVGKSLKVQWKIKIKGLSFIPSLFKWVRFTQECFIEALHSDYTDIEQSDVAKKAFVLGQP